MRLFHTLRGQLSDREEGRIRVRQTGQHKAKRVKILLFFHAAQNLGGARFSGAGSRYGSFAKCGTFLCHTGQMGGVCLSGFRMKKADRMYIRTHRNTNPWQKKQ